MPCLESRARVFLDAGAEPGRWARSVTTTLRAKKDGSSGVLTSQRVTDNRQTPGPRGGVMHTRDVEYYTNFDFFSTMQRSTLLRINMFGQTFYFSGHR